MLDSFGREINYLRISVTDRCNHRCVYCMPQEGVTLVRHENVLSFEEIFDVTSTAVDMGIDKVRITGGEPLARRGIVKLVSMLAGIGGIKDLAMTTNGAMLEDYARLLAQVGLDRVNISLDTLDARKYREITRGGEISKVLVGIEAAKSAGLEPIKLNCVIARSSQEHAARDVASFAKDNNLEVRFIRRMDIAAGRFWVVQGGTGGQCTCCNRLRLSSEGMVLPCLFSDLGFRVRELGAREAIEQAVNAKPQSGKTSRSNTFYNIGG